MKHRVPPRVAATCALGLLAVVVSGTFLTGKYTMYFQETELVEVLQIGLLAVASGFAFQALRRRRDRVGVALLAFLLFVIGEELNWGQELPLFGIAEAHRAAFPVDGDFSIHNLHGSLVEGVLENFLYAFLLLPALPLAILRAVGLRVPPIDHLFTPQRRFFVLAALIFYIVATLWHGQRDELLTHAIEECFELLLYGVFLLYAIALWRDEASA